MLQNYVIMPQKALISVIMPGASTIVLCSKLCWYTCVYSTPFPCEIVAKTGLHNWKTAPTSTVICCSDIPSAEWLPPNSYCRTRGVDSRIFPLSLILFVNHFHKTNMFISWPGKWRHVIPLDVTLNDFHASSNLPSNSLFTIIFYNNNLCSPTKNYSLKVCATPTCLLNSLWGNCIAFIGTTFSSSFWEPFWALLIHLLIYSHWWYSTGKITRRGLVWGWRLLSCHVLCSRLSTTFQLWVLLREIKMILWPLHFSLATRWELSYAV